MENIKENYFTLNEASEKLNKSRRTLYNWDSIGKLKIVKIVGGSYIRISDVEKLLP